MGVRFLPDRSPFLRGPVSGAPAGDADVTAWVAAVVTNGGTVSAGRTSLVSTLVSTWRAAGIWDLIDDAWLLVAENEPQALTSLKQRRLATVVAAPVFTIDRGYALNGSTSYIDTGFIPNTHKVAMTGTNMHIAVYERTNLGQISVAAGCYSFSTTNLFIYPRRSDNVMAAQLGAALGAGGGATVTDSRGLAVGSRNGTLISDVLTYKNGVSVVPQPATSVGSTLPTTKVFVGGYASASNVLTAPRAATEGFVSVGAAIPAGQQPAFYNAIQEFMASIGAAIDPDAALWAAAVVTNGGTVSQARTELVSSFIIAEKAAGTWALTDDYWALWAENAPQALTSLKQRRLAIATNAPAFAVDRGYTSDGTTSYIDTGFFLNLHPVAMTGTNLRIGAYLRSNIGSASQIPTGQSSGTTQNLLVIPRTAGNVLQAWVNASAVGPGGDTVLDSRGWSVASRNGTLIGDVKAYKNGVAILPYAPGAVTSVLATRQIFICAACVTGGAPGSFHTGQVSFVAAGAALSPAQELAQYNNVQAWATAVGAAIDPDAQLWAAAVIANGGTVSGARQTIVQTFIAAEKAAGTWQLTDDYWGLWAENAPQALTSLKRRVLATAVNSPVFTPDRDYTFNGTSSYINTGMVPNAVAGNLTGVQHRLAVYERTNVSTNTTSIGSFGPFNLYLRARGGASIMYAALHTSTAASFVITDSRGFTAASRVNGATTIRSFKNGVALTDATGLTVAGATTSTQPLFIAALCTGGGTPSQWRAASIGFACAGAPLSDAQETSQYNNVQAWATSVGANV